MRQEDVLLVCVREALLLAMEEAEKTPLAVGEHVGHTNFVYHSQNGLLQGYEGDEAIIKNPLSEETWKWPTKGTVSIKRVSFFLDIFLRDFDKIMVFTTLTEALIGGASRENDDPTPGCDCEYCKTFTPEQHETARQKLEAKKDGGGFPFDEFLKAIGATDPDPGVAAGGTGGGN